MTPVCLWELDFDGVCLVQQLRTSIPATFLSDWVRDNSKFRQDCILTTGRILMNSLARTNQDKQNGGTIQRVVFCAAPYLKNPSRCSHADAVSASAIREWWMKSAPRLSPSARSARVRCCQRSWRRTPSRHNQVALRPLKQTISSLRT
jgi:hypothetical protein